MSSRTVRNILFVQLLFTSLAYGMFVYAQSNPNNNTNIANAVGTINSSSDSTNNRIAPGEFLPIAVKLVNFGSLSRVDVTINYQILDSSGKEVFSESETVAVETTASFIKQLQLPSDLKNGQYTAVSSLHYPYQEQPAVSKFTFTVENKIFGIFESDLILYCVIAFLIILVVLVLWYLFNRWNRKHSIVLHDYSDKPKDQMIYYEILSDIISQMRLRIGNDALEIAKNIPDLEINDKTGLIVDIKKEPAKIIALLIFRYEKISGRRLSFGLR